MSGGKKETGKKKLKPKKTKKTKKKNRNPLWRRLAAGCREERHLPVDGETFPSEGKRKKAKKRQTKDEMSEETVRRVSGKGGGEEGKWQRGRKIFLEGEENAEK